VDRESAREILGAKMAAADAAVDAAKAAADKAKADAEYAKQKAASDKAQQKAERDAQREYERILRTTGGQTRTRRRPQASPLEEILGSKTTQTIIGSVIRGVFGNGRRR
jgi:vacuolar-type H+-ATPase subunit E/Vma4